MVRIEAIIIICIINIFTVKKSINWIGYIFIILMLKLVNYNDSFVFGYILGFT